MTAISKIKSNRILEQTMDEAFPVIDSEHIPFGSRVLLQIKSPATRTRAGLVLNQNDVETEHDNTKIAKVIAIGAGAFRNRETLEIWPEGEWVKVGDFVRIGLYEGQRWKKLVGVKRHAIKQRDEADKIEIENVYAFYTLVEDLTISAKFTGDPLTTVAFFQ